MNACIVRCTIDKKVLLVKHRRRQWEFPGGKVDFFKDDFGEDTGYYDLLKTATREFQEEVSDEIGCIGSPDKILFKPFEPEGDTVFFVYLNQLCAFDCFTKYKAKLSQDEAIEQVQQFDLNEINELYFSYEHDKNLINALLT
jgi:8-oxo-dGTP pyrophosphatase MutT (NUDIX family)